MSWTILKELRRYSSGVKETENLNLVSARRTEHVSSRIKYGGCRLQTALLHVCLFCPFQFSHRAVAWKRLNPVLLATVNTEHSL